MGYKNLSLKSRLKQVLAFCAVGAVICSSVQVHASADRAYTITLKAGSHGSFDGEASYSEEFNYGETVDLSTYEPAPESGYYFTEWSPETNNGVIEVTGTETYVAKYKRVIDAVDYRVNYVLGTQDNGPPVATAEVKSTQRDTKLKIKAKENIEGYRLLDTKNSVEVEMTYSGIQVTFHYASTAPAAGDTVENVTETETVVLPGDNTTINETTTTPGTTTTTPGTTTTTPGTTTAAPGAGNENAATPAAPGTETGGTEQPTEPTVTIPEEDVPLANGDGADTTGLTDEETPKANASIGEKNKGWIFAAAGGGLVAAAGAAVAIIARRRKKL